MISKDRYQLLRILYNYLKNHSKIEINGVTYGLSEDDEIIRMTTEERGIPLPGIKRYWQLIDSIDEQTEIMMGASNVLTNIGREKDERRKS